MLFWSGDDCRASIVCDYKRDGVCSNTAWSFMRIALKLRTLIPDVSSSVDRQETTSWSGHDPDPELYQIGSWKRRIHELS